MVSLLKKCFYSRWSLQVRMAYVAFKADLKARKECHTFVKYYKCKNFCDRCDAIQPFTNVPVRLTYKNMSPTAPYVGTEINHDQYMATTLPRHVSPWERHVENWQFETCVFDFMHVVYLGVARDLVPSCFKLLQHLGYGCEDGETDDVFLKRVTMEMRATCKLFGTPERVVYFVFATICFFRCAVQIPRLYLPRRVLTESNCSGYGNDDYAELGSKFKAQHVKCMVWFLARKLEELSADSVSG